MRTGAGCSESSERVRYEWPYSFKKWAIEEQTTFNAKVEEALGEAESNLSSILTTPVFTPAVLRIKEETKKGWLQLEERQKLIRLVDCSKNGGSRVDEYTVTNLANNSDNERWIEKAERAADRKAGKRHKKRSSQACQAKSRGGPPAGMQHSTVGTPVVMAPLTQPNSRWYLWQEV